MEPEVPKAGHDGHRNHAGPGSDRDLTPADARIATDLARLEHLTTWLDSKYRVPKTPFYVGLDPLVGLLPVVGDLASAAVSVYLLAIARRLGASPGLIARMGVNVAADALLGMIPFLGPVIDVIYRANTQNLSLMLEDLQRRHAEKSLEGQPMAPIPRT